ncbi:hypothetical protein TW79_22350 [Tritonibacter mobilis]|uniref:Uncharacterized protein n=1 Tax=Tritonibacter mobilis F1926 TaxID=1265309 RepID=A0A1B1A7S5_9RHOB|nr:hypothetical protein K529_017560 [Tritonibacter mobilis F1926]KJZ21489.1 hypothetical protein TW79_22350 [Tritonibacter mobilis]
MGLSKALARALLPANLIGFPIATQSIRLTYVNFMLKLRHAIFGTIPRGRQIVNDWREPTENNSVVSVGCATAIAFLGWDWPSAAPGTKVGCGPSPAHRLEDFTFLAMPVEKMPCRSWKGLES